MKQSTAGARILVCVYTDGQTATLMGPVQDTEEPTKKQFSCVL
jgi:hypothetical protein